ncbi:pantothenate transporter liz1 [Lecanosticta acicola]|uniref:Pantothenate transporter liz1 n=1 Tax=Lecanosticta acicola TaxID=111012 RepID=A0AAI8Z257_9PEZI|nr:pantothenate transporter liz1 [Lecanosticta acicola]
MATEFIKNFRSFIWDSDAHLKTLEERKLLRKLDFSILTIACLGFFLKYLDQGNLSNAYVSGMQEDLRMLGNEYTYATTCYTVAYAVMQIPSNMIVQYIRPSYWLAVMEIAWGAFTFAQAGLKSSTQLYVMRFFVGFFESSFFPVLLFVLGSWYTKTELAKRIAIFHMTAPIGSAFGGYLQAAVYENLDGHHGLAGWRWLYIICGCMTVPVGFATWFALPDTPYKTKAWYLSEDEKQLAIERIRKAGKAAPAKVSLATFKRVLGGWHWYAFVLGYVIYGSSCQASSYFGIWLKAEGFSVVDRNIIPTGTNLISGFCVILWGFLSDFTGSRFWFVFGPLAYGLIPNGILAFWPSSQNAKLYAFLTCVLISYTWANEICAGDNEERAIVISSMNGFQYAVAAWLPILIFPQTMAPTFRYGFPSTFGFVIAGLLAVVAIQALHSRDLRRSKRLSHISEDEGEAVIDQIGGQILKTGQVSRVREMHELS